MLDEIEKAHPDVLNILLQILDDGRVTDAQGRIVNFENTIIVMTSNAGSDHTETLMGFGITKEEASRDKALKALKEFLRPEFIARVDEIVVFGPLDKESLEKIAKLMLNELKDAMLEKRIELTFDNTVCNYLAQKAEGAKAGARELRSLIRKEIEDIVVDLIIDNADAKINEIKLTADKKINVSKN